MWLWRDYYFERLQREQISELLTFYILGIYEHFNFTSYNEAYYQAEFRSLQMEDAEYFDRSIYYVLRDKKENRICGSIRTMFWDKKCSLPIEKLFNIDPLKLVTPSISNYWHIGRFAISRSVINDRISILKQMLFNAFYPIYALGNGLIIAECDKKVTVTLRKMKIESFVLGKSIEYICSETLPIYIKSDWMEVFIETNFERYYAKTNEEDKRAFLKMINSDKTKMPNQRIHWSFYGCHLKLTIKVEAKAMKG